MKKSEFRSYMADYWFSKKPEKCDMCQGSINNYFIDGKTVYGSWAIMHKACHSQYGVGLGTGKGQAYKLQEDGKWKKVAG